MIKFILGIVIINIIIVGITDMTDAMSLLKKIVIWIFTKGKLWTDKYDAKLLECSLCQVFHISNIWLLAYCIYYGVFNLWMLPVPIISALLTKLTYNIMLIILYFIDTTINILNTLLDKINKSL